MMRERITWTVPRMVLLILFVVTCSNVKQHQELGKDARMKSIYDFVVKDIDGNDVKLGRFRGNVLLIVNVASKCGFTPQ